MSTAPDLVDTHCHLTDPGFTGRLPAVLESARDAGVAQIIAMAYSRASWQPVLALTAERGVFAGIGLHPWHATEKLDVDALCTLVENERIVAVGEIGLDFAIEGVDRERQRSVLLEQVLLARDLGLPISLHCRKAFGELIELLKPLAPVAGVVHAFSRSAELGRAFVRLGLHLGLAGTVTHQNARRVHSLARELPLDRLVLETDAPSIGLLDVPAERVEPRHTAVIAAAVARLRDTSTTEIARVTSENARQLFSLE